MSESKKYTKGIDELFNLDTCKEAYYKDITRCKGHLQ